MRNEVSNPFPWILWYLWKFRNDKMFNNMDHKPLNTLKYALGEATPWEQSQLLDVAGIPSHQVQTVFPTSIRSVCQVDGSWTCDNLFSGLGWCPIQATGVLTSISAKGQRRSLTPLHAELEVLIWEMKCMVMHHELTITFHFFQTDLVKMVSDPEVWPAFSTLLTMFICLIARLCFFSICYFPRSLNGKSDCLACSALSRSLDFMFVNSTAPVWLTKLFLI